MEINLPFDPVLYSKLRELVFDGTLTVKLNGKAYVATGIGWTELETIDIYLEVKRECIS